MVFGANISISTRSNTERKTFTTKYDGSMVITNFKPQDPNVLAEQPKGDNDFRIDIREGFSISSVGMTTKVSKAEYSIFQALSNLDGDQTNISKADLKKAKSLIGKLGITKIRRDDEAGVVTIVHNGGQIRFDVVDDKQQDAIDWERKIEKDLADFKKNGYDEFYSIEVHPNRKMYRVTVKNTVMLYPDPMIGDIKSDFGLDTGVFTDWNPSLIGEHPQGGIGSNYDYDKLAGGTTFNIPIGKCSFSHGATGFWGRLVE